MNRTNTRIAFLLSLGSLGLLASLGALAGCSERDRLTLPDDRTPVEQVDDGWDAFSRGDFEGAESDFEGAIADSATFGEAYTGLGWAKTSRATTSSVLDEAIASFTQAVGLGQGADALAGRSAAKLARPDLTNAIADAQAARAASPSFVFAFRTSFTVADLRLIEAFAQAGLGQFGAALAVADQITSSGIQQGNPSTWVVDGTTFPSFQSAVLAHLQKLSNQFAG